MEGQVEYKTDGGNTAMNEGAASSNILTADEQVDVLDLLDDLVQAQAALGLAARAFEIAERALVLAEALALRQGYESGEITYNGERDHARAEALYLHADGDYRAARDARDDARDAARTAEDNLLVVRTRVDLTRAILDARAASGAAVTGEYQGASAEELPLIEIARLRARLGEQ